MQAERKISVVKRDANRAIVPPDGWESLIELRRGLLQALAAIEKKLGISRKCRRCGHALSE